MQPIQIKGFTRTFNGVVKEILTECGVSIPHNPSSGAKHPPIIKTTGLWDTGATNSVITKTLATQLKLTPISTVESHHAGGKSTVNVYLINIFLPNQVGISFVQVSECVDTVGRFGILIGMDIFSRGDFAMSHAGGNTTISFRMPSVQPIRLETDCLPTQTKNEPATASKAQGRNELCNCGSGKKYKHCHGKGK